jgi:hypothetical protein
MASLWTNKLAFRILGWAFNGVTIPTNFFVALVTSATAPTVDINTKSQLTEVANGQGYTTGGISLAPDNTDFDVLTEDDGNDRALVQIRDLTWTATAGGIPASGDAPRYAVLTDDNVTEGSREVFASFDLGTDRPVSDGNDLVLQDCELRITTA